MGKFKEPLLNQLCTHERFGMNAIYQKLTRGMVSRKKMFNNEFIFEIFIVFNILSIVTKST